MMHTIKHQARNIAWKSGNEENANYNPFAVRSRSYLRTSIPADEETGLHRRSTAGQAEQQARELENGGAVNGNYNHPAHANTDPARSSIHNAHPHNLANADITSPLSMTSGQSPPSNINALDEKDGQRIARTNSSDLTAARSIPESEQNGGEQKHVPRKRLKILGILGQPDRTGKGNDSDDNADPDSKKGKKKRKRHHTSPWTQFKAVIFGSWINVLLITIPIGFAVKYANLNGYALFIVNFVAIVPLAAMLSFATEELALYVGETLGGLLNASFGNATELIVGVIALAKGNIVIVQTSLIGSMLSNLLLVLGMCFFFGGVNRVTQHFNQTVAQTAASMLALAIGSLIIPTAFTQFGTGDDKIPEVSHGVAVILLFVYAAYLYFQLKTHAHVYSEPSEKSEKIKGSKKDKGEVLRGLATMGAGSAAAAGGQIHQSNLVHNSEDEEELPTLSVISALVTLTAATVLIAFCSEFMVDGIDYIVETGNISEEFVGLILVPIVGNAAEHATAVTVAIKDKMDLAIGVAVGSSMQIALLVLPLMVIISWCGVGNEAMTLDFDGFQVSVLFIAILLVNYLIQDGESHWLEGTLLMCLYIIIATTAWFYPVTGAVG